MVQINQVITELRALPVTLRSQSMALRKKPSSRSSLVRLILRRLLNSLMSPGRSWSQDILKVIMALMPKIVKRLMSVRGWSVIKRYLHISTTAATIILQSPLENICRISDQSRVLPQSKSLKVVSGSSLKALNRLLRQELARSRLNAENLSEKADRDALTLGRGQLMSICRFSIDVCLLIGGLMFDQLNNCFGLRLPLKMELRTASSFWGLWSECSHNSVDVWNLQKL